ncbi:MAG: class I SAM-dependent methyltransferase, partial [Pseudomonadales bacterium]
RSPHMSEANKDQIEFWNGEAGNQWVAEQAYLDSLLAPLSEQALAAAAPKATERVLDVGCGCGTTSLLLAQRCAEILGVDISGPMIKRAQESSADQANASFTQADASAWRGDQPFDLAFSRFGVMFFDDPVAAFSNIRRNLSDSGRLCFICWRAPQDNPWLAVPMAAAQPFLPEAPAADGPNPFAFADTDFVTDVLTQAGFQAPNFALTETQLTLGQGIEEAIAFLTRIGPLSRVVSELDQPTQEKALAAARAALEPLVSAEGLRMDASTWIVTAAASPS